MRQALLAFALAGAVACGPEGTRCVPRAVVPTGNLAKDVLGAWGGHGIDSTVLDAFETDGGQRLVEPPNRYAPNGQVVVSAYAVDGGFLFFQERWSPAVVDGGFLILLDEVPSPTSTFPALSCTGYGFD